MAFIHNARFFRTTCLAMLTVLATAWPVHGSALVTSPGSRELRNNGNGNFKGVVGYELMVGPADVQITHLGIYDGPGNASSPSSGAVGDGLEQSAAVGIYGVADQKLIVEATVPEGEQGELVDGFRYVKLETPVTLKAGHQYRLVAGVSRGGNAFLNYRHGQSDEPILSPDFKVDDRVYHNDSQGDHASLAYPRGYRVGSPYMGPSFRYTGGAPFVADVPIPTEDPGDRLKNIDSMPGKLVIAQDFEKVQDELPPGWAMRPADDRQRQQGISFVTPGAGQAGHSMKVNKNPRGNSMGKFGGLTYDLPEAAQRVALTFDVKAYANRNFYPSIELFSFDENSNDPTQLRMRIHLDRLQQFGSIRDGWVRVPFGLTPAPKQGSASPWYRVKLVIDQQAQGIDVYISKPNQPALPDKPVATVPAYDPGKPIKSIGFGTTAVVADNHAWIDNIAIHTGPEIPLNPQAAAQSEKQDTYNFWLPDEFPRAFSNIDYPQGIEHHIVATRGGQWKWFHGTSIEHHKGKLYASWAANPHGENRPGEVVLVSESSDGGKTWSDATILAPGDGKGGSEYSNSHGTLLSHQGKLWGFFQHWAGGWDNPLSTEAFILNEETGKWESQGIVARQGWPLDRPKKTVDGNWVMGVSGFKMRQPGVMISDGDNLTKWDTIAIPTGDQQSRFPETSVIVDGNDVLSITRWPGDRALVSISHDGGRTWADAKRSNMPMTTSKPDSGMLSTGQWYAVINIEDRDTLAVAVGKPGEKGLSKVYKIRHDAPAEKPYAYQGRTFSRAYAYPYGFEHDGKLYVIYSVNKADCEVAIIPIASLKAE